MRSDIKSDLQKLDLMDRTLVLYFALSVYLRRVPIPVKATVLAGFIFPVLALVKR